MEKERKNFTKKSYEKLKNTIQEIVNEKDRKDVHVLSLCYTCDDKDLRFPRVTLSCNTLLNVKEESYNAASKEDAKWNYDYWLQTEVGTIGGKKDKQLEQWFAKIPYFYSDEEDDRATEEDKDLYEKILKKGDRSTKEFIKEVTALARRPIDEGEVERVFTHNISIIIYQQEFEETPILWTKKVNSIKLIKEFLDCFDGDDE